jgi:hypothetical protein
MPAKIVLPIHAKEGETVEIHWHTEEGHVYHQRVTCPPQATRDATKAQAEPKQNADR